MTAVDEPDFDAIDNEVAQRRLMEAALPLVAAGARDGRFPADMAELERFVEHLGRRVDGLKATTREEIDFIGGEFEVWVATNDDGSLHLKSTASRGNALVCDLWPDGLVTGSASSQGYAHPAVEDLEVTPLGREVITTSFSDEGVFEGKELKRVVSAPLAPGASIQVLSVELYADGLVVNYLLRPRIDGDDQQDILRRRFEALDAATTEDDLDVIARREGFLGLDPGLIVEDDLGTSYVDAGGGGGGSPGGVTRWHAEFTPAVPDVAGLLRLKTPADTIEIPL